MVGQTNPPSKNLQVVHIVQLENKRKIFARFSANNKSFTETWLEVTAGGLFCAMNKHSTGLMAAQRGEKNPRNKSQHTPSLGN